MLDKIVKTAIGPVTDLISEYIKDPDKAAELKDRAEARLHEALMADKDLIRIQAETNREQAKHPSMFVAGARPGTHWVLNFALAYALIARDLIIVIAMWNGHDLTDLPELDAWVIWGMLGGMLGLHGVRMQEKIKGVARDNLKPPVK